MKKTLLAVMAMFLVVRIAQADIEVKEGLSYSVYDSNFEQVSLLQVFKKDSLSLNVGLRSNDTVVADIGYDLGETAAPAKSFVKDNAMLKPFYPILNFVNPSVGVYIGSKIIRDNHELVLNRSELDYGVTITAISIKW